MRAVLHVEGPRLHRTVLISSSASVGRAGSGSLGGIYEDPTTTIFVIQEGLFAQLERGRGLWTIYGFPETTPDAARPSPQGGFGSEAVEVGTPLRSPDINIAFSDLLQMLIP